MLISSVTIVGRPLPTVFKLGSLEAGPDELLKSLCSIDDVLLRVECSIEDVVCPELLGLADDARLADLLSVEEDGLASRAVVAASSRSP